MTALLAFALGGLGTYLMRASFLAIIGPGVIPVAIERALRYVGPAAFAAIFLPRVLGEDGLRSFTQLPTAEMLAAVVAGFVAWKTRKVPATLIVGMGALWLFQWLA